MLQLVDRLSYILPIFCESKRLISKLEPRRTHDVLTWTGPDILEPTKDGNKTQSIVHNYTQWFVLLPGFSIPNEPSRCSDSTGANHVLMRPVSARGSTSLDIPPHLSKEQPRQEWSIRHHLAELSCFATGNHWHEEESLSRCQEFWKAYLTHCCTGCCLDESDRPLDVGKRD